MDCEQNNLGDRRTSQSEYLKVRAIPKHRIIVPHLGRPMPSKTLPAVSIITTVYDRADCLRRCIQSVCALNFIDYEQIIVADSPPFCVIDEMKAFIEDNERAIRRTILLCLAHRHNDWGITPARLGLYFAKGKYVCFLSDDNGYLPHHLDNLTEELDNDPSLGFCYSSCLYDGRRVLASPVPMRKQIDLGQPLFRRGLFDAHLGGTIPFKERCWDWAVIRTLVEGGVCFRHLNQATFVFRLARYPHLWPGQPSSDGQQLGRGATPGSRTPI